MKITKHEFCLYFVLQNFMKEIPFLHICFVLNDMLFSGQFKREIQLLCIYGLARGPFYGLIKETGLLRELAKASDL